MKATLNGKEIKVLDKKEIAVEFTNKVNELLAQGFIYNFAENSRGHQGEEMKISLTNDCGNTVYVVFLNRGCTSELWRDSLTIYVKKYENAKNKSTLWNNEGETVSEKTFYCISDRYHEDSAKFVDDKEVFEEIVRTQKERWHNTHPQFVRKLSDKSIRYAYRLLKKKKYYKSVQMKNVEFVERRNDKIFVKLSTMSYAVEL